MEDNLAILNKSELYQNKMSPQFCISNLVKDDFSIYLTSPNSKCHSIILMWNRKLRIYFKDLWKIIYKTLTWLLTGNPSYGNLFTLPRPRLITRVPMPWTWIFEPAISFKFWVSVSFSRIVSNIIHKILDLTPVLHRKWRLVEWHYPKFKHFWFLSTSIRRSTGRKRGTNWRDGYW